MGELIQGWDDLEEFEVFPPNCPKCLVQMEFGERHWECPECGLAKVS